MPVSGNDMHRIYDAGSQFQASVGKRRDTRMMPGIKPKQVRMRLMKSWPHEAVLRKTARGRRKIARMARMAVPRPIVRGAVSLCSVCLCEWYCGSLDDGVEF
jgi:hypothetical protein